MTTHCLYQLPMVDVDKNIIISQKSKENHYTNLCPESVVFLEAMGTLSHDFGWHTRYSIYIQHRTCLVLLIFKMV
jgi:hypothetical protein